MASECFSRTGCSTRAHYSPCIPVHRTSPEGPDEGETACSSPRGGLCKTLVACDPPKCPLCAGLRPSHCREGELENLCAVLLVQLLGGDWQVRGTRNLCAAAGSLARATSIELCLSLWRLTEEQSTGPLPLQLLLPRLQMAGSSCTRARTLASLSKEELSIANHHERIFFGDKIRGSSFPLPPPHPPSPPVAAPPRL